MEPEGFEKLFLDTRVKIPKSLRLFFVSEKKYLYVNNGQVRSSSSINGVMGKLTRVERGPVLARFAEFEFLINEFLRYAIMGYQTNDRLIDVIVRHPINQKIGFLESWKLIDSKLAKSLRRIFKVRDGFAHKFDERDTIYKDKQISITFNDFVNDMQETWNKLIVEYNNNLEINISHILREIENYSNEK